MAFGPVSLAIGFAAIALFSASLFNMGAHYATSSTRESITTLYKQTAPIWNQEISAQRALLNDARDNAEKNLDALSMRLSKLQGHIMRLDALGARLASMAGVGES